MPDSSFNTAVNFVANTHLNPVEFRLLGALLKEPGRVLTHRHLLRAVWGPSASEHCSEPGIAWYYLAIV